MSESSARRAELENARLLLAEDDFLILCGSQGGRARVKTQFWAAICAAD